MIDSWSWLTNKVCVAILRHSYSNSPCDTALISKFSSQSWSETMTEPDMQHTGNTANSVEHYDITAHAFSVGAGSGD